MTWLILRVANITEKTQRPCQSGKGDGVRIILAFPPNYFHTIMAILLRYAWSTEVFETIHLWRMCL